jgi:hypothetical protein
MEMQRAQEWGGRRFDPVQEISLPREGASHGLLAIRHGISEADLRAEAMEPLLRGRFEGVMPRVECAHGDVTLSFRLSPLEWLQAVTLGGTGASLCLQAGLPWAIEISGGASRITADLRGVTLCSLVITGGASEVTLDLPAATGVVPLRIGGGCSRLRLRRPPGTGVRLDVHGGATSVQLDRQRLGAVGGRLQLASPGEGTYDLRVGGGASSLAIATYPDDAC